jgi:hypothetical protein
MADNSTGNQFVNDIKNVPAFKAVGGAINKAVDFVKSQDTPTPSTPDAGPRPTAKQLGWADQPAPKKTTPAPVPTKKPAPSPTPAPKYHKGTDYVPKTGPAVLKKGEAVLNTKDADKLRTAKGKGMSKDSAMKSVADELGGKKEAAPKKEIKHIVTRKAAGGKSHIHTHVHHNSTAHPDEEHVTTGDDAMAEHMMQNMGTPNPGEQEADAGQGAPAGAAPQPGGSAPGAAPAAPPVAA